MTPTNCPHCGMGWDAKMGEFECRSYPSGSGVVRSTACVEISRLRAELDALRAGVAVVVPERTNRLSFWKHANGTWYCWDGWKNTEMTPSRVLKDGEVAVDAEYFAALRYLQSCARKWRHGETMAVPLLNASAGADALRSQEGGA